jgi:hypothetical protein
MHSSSETTSNRINCHSQLIDIDLISKDSSVQRLFTEYRPIHLYKRISHRIATMPGGQRELSGDLMGRYQGMHSKLFCNGRFMNDKRLIEVITVILAVD